MEIDTKSLKYVYFESSEIESFPVEFTMQLRGVLYLNANGVGLERVDGKSLEMLRELVIFWGGSNNIERLEANAFSRNKQLQAIFLTFNQIRFIHHAAFIGLEKLVILDLSSNKLTAVFNVFDSLGALQKLELSSNLIEKINTNAFSKLKALKVLSLQKNNLTSLDPNLFDPLTSLESFDISFNKSPIKSISGNLLQNNSRVKKIFLIGNQIEAIDQKFIDNRKPSLEVLALGYNLCFDSFFPVLKNGTLERNEKLKLSKCFENFNQNY